MCAHHTEQEDNAHLNCDEHDLDGTICRTELSSVGWQQGERDDGRKDLDKAETEEGRLHGPGLRVSIALQKRRGTDRPDVPTCRLHGGIALGAHLVPPQPVPGSVLKRSYLICN